MVIKQENGVACDTDINIKNIKIKIFKYYICTEGGGVEVPKQNAFVISSVTAHANAWSNLRIFNTI